MGRRVERARRPYVPPVKRIELSKENIKSRWIATILFLVVGLASIAVTLYVSLTPEAGWEEIKANASDTENCSGEFSLVYHLGTGETSLSKEKKAIAGVYTAACETAHKLFHSTAEYEGVQNIAYINSHPNETVTVDPKLYKAFEQLENSGIRHQYMGPAYETYNGVFYCREEYQTADYDPLQNDELRAYFSEIAAFAADPEAVHLELLDENRVCLRVSEAYLKFSEENETNRFLDLYWMKNAFIADFIAEQLTESGYTHGVLSSYDGFVRSMEDADSTDFRFILFDRKGNTVYPAATELYSGQRSMVYLRSYPASELDMRHYSLLSDGEIRVPYLDIADGLPKASVGGMASSSKTLGCAEILLSVLPNFVGDSFDEAQVLELVNNGIDTVFCQDGVLSHTSPETRLVDVHPDETVVCITE